MRRRTCRPSQRRRPAGRRSARRRRRRAARTRRRERREDARRDGAWRSFVRGAPARRGPGRGGESPWGRNQGAGEGEGRGESGHARSTGPGAPRAGSMGGRHAGQVSWLPDLPRTPFPEGMPPVVLRRCPRSQWRGPRRVFTGLPSCARRRREGRMDPPHAGQRPCGRPGQRAPGKRCSRPAEPRPSRPTGSGGEGVAKARELGDPQRPSRVGERTGKPS